MPCIIIIIIININISFYLVAKIGVPL